MGKLSMEHNAKLFAERIYDVLWHNNALKEEVSEEDIRRYLIEDIKIQLELILKEE